MTTTTTAPRTRRGLTAALAGLALIAQASAFAQGTEPTACTDGFAGEFPCDGVDFLSFLSIAELGGDADTKVANVWGWEDPADGREYVLLGLTDSTAFIDVTEPTAPRLVGKLPTQTTDSKWRDIKTYRDHAFIIADVPSVHGMQVFDLGLLRNANAAAPATFAADAHFTGFGDAHNLYINRESGFAYVVRTTTPELCNGALYMVDIREPLSPAFAGCVEDGGLASDSYCVTYRGDDVAYRGRELCVIASDDDLIVADVTDKTAPVTLATLGYANIARAHNAWFSASHNHFITVDMNDELNTGANTRVFSWDLRDVDNPTLIGVYDGPTGASDHNVWLRGDKAYVGNFRAGVRILDASGLEDGVLEQEAFFDMIPSDDNPGHIGGAWAVYPFFASRTLAVADKEAGLYLLRQQRAEALTLDLAYTMADGSTGKQSLTLFDDSSFDDAAGQAGTWSMRPARPGLVVQFDDATGCSARLIGRFDPEAGLRGVRLCTDGSGARGVWTGTLQQAGSRRPDAR
ncbi:MAG: choice-of-anchor B family protein [Pseudomonadota bacterium]